MLIHEGKEAAHKIRRNMLATGHALGRKDLGMYAADAMADMLGTFLVLLPADKAAEFIAAADRMYGDAERRAA